MSDPSLPRRISATRGVRLALALGAVAVLTLSFFANSFGVVPPDWFRGYQKDSESLLIGRLIQNRTHGLLSAAGLTGRQAHPSAPERIRPFQYEAYFNGLSGEEFTPYLSQSGLHALFYGLLDLSLGDTAPRTRYQILRGVTAFTTALALTLVVGWFFIELGWLPALMAFLSIFTSQWLTVTAANLWWALGFFFVPMMVVAGYVRRRAGAAPARLALVVFLSMVLKCLTGYEFVTAVSIMTATPVAFWHLRARTSWRLLAGEVAAVAAASFAAVLATLALLVVQVGWWAGSLSKGIDAVSYAWRKRTYGDPEQFSGLLRASLESSLADAVSPYFTGYFYAGRLISVSYLHLIVLFAIATVVLGLLMKADGDGGRRSIALIGTTWFSITAPLSWLVIFKAHSYIHTHVNFLLWQLPFTIFGFALVGLAMQRMGAFIGARLQAGGRAAG